MDNLKLLNKFLVLTTFLARIVRWKKLQVTYHKFHENIATNVFVLKPNLNFVPVNVELSVNLSTVLNLFEKLSIVTKIFPRNYSISLVISNFWFCLISSFSASLSLFHLVFISLIIYLKVFIKNLDYFFFRYLHLLSSKFARCRTYQFRLSNSDNRSPIMKWKEMQRFVNTTTPERQCQEGGVSSFRTIVFYWSPTYWV